MKNEFIPADGHWTLALGLFSENITAKQLRSLLLGDHQPIIRGRLCKWKSKHLGVGIYELRAGLRE